MTLDNDKLQAYGISSTLVNAAVANNNSSYPAGSVTDTESRLSIRLDAKVNKVDDLRKLILRENADGSRVILDDVATVTDALTEATTINRINSKPGIGINC